jgi:hypothetical protein
MLILYTQLVFLKCLRLYILLSLVFLLCATLFFKFQKDSALKRGRLVSSVQNVELLTSTGAGVSPTSQLRSASILVLKMGYGTWHTNVNMMCDIMAGNAVTSRHQ